MGIPTQLYQNFECLDGIGWTEIEQYLENANFDRIEDLP